MEETVEFRKIIDLLIKGKKIIIISSVITLVLSSIISWFYLDEKYESRAVIQLSSNAQDSGIVSNYVAHEFSADVYLQRVANEGLIRTAFAENNFEEFSLKNIKAENPINTNLVEIFYSSRSPEDAKQGLEIILDTTSQAMEEAVEHSLKSLENMYLSEAEALSNEIEDLMDKYNTLIIRNKLPEVLILQTVSSNQFVIEMNDKQTSALKNINGVIQNELLQLKTKIDTNSREYSSILSKYQSAKTGLNSFDADSFIRVIVEPTLPEMPASPNKPLNLLIGLFLGTVLGIGVVLFKNFWKESANN